MWAAPRFVVILKENRTMTIDELIEKAYGSFNSRDIDGALTAMHGEVQWPKAFEGGYVAGHDGIRDYWMRQWSEIDPRVTPTAINERENGTVAVTVQQLVKDLQGKVLFDGVVTHVYTLRDGLLQRMDIELP
jgi:hypothetical protein